ncbi:hypothetical protein J7643_16925 [bacterium]|nr:hypothetical protein [bacterium]
MKTKWLTQALTLGISAGILTAPTLAMAATKTMNGPTVKIPETRDGVKGNVHEYVEYTYVDVASRVNNLAAGSGLSAADIQAVIQLVTQNPGMTDAQIQAEINRIKASKTVQGVIDQFAAQYATQMRSASTYSQAGALALMLAQKLQATGAYSGNTVRFDGQYWYGSAHNWAVSTGLGWPLEAAMIHGPDYTPAGTVINEQALLKAWAIVIQYTGTSLADPLVLDLNGNGKIDVTGKSSAKFRNKDNMTFVSQGSVLFDLLGTGKEIRTEWVQGGDGLLVDNRKNKAFDLVKQGKPLSIANLFGDDGGKFSGFVKLAKEFDPNAKLAASTGGIPANLGILKGKTLDDMLVWIDDGDGKATAKELHKLSALGITEIKLPARFVTNEAGEYLERATFTRNGKEFGIQEVWFANEK